MISDTRYKAFISYSHVDSAFARKLHRQLEQYRLPKYLVGSETARGAIGERLTPIFRDIDELPASEDLTTEIKTALDQSEALIVLCSPAARQSHWVAREVELFRELHGTSRPIFAAIVSGEPKDVLLPQLAVGNKDADPIAADFRPGKDGNALALLKLVAGLTGASLNSLVQRDSQRRMRRVMAVTAAALIAMLIMATLTLMAVRSRAEAERQRASAEGLIEFMLTDLRVKLDGVGRLDIMSTVNARAIGYYSSAKLDDLKPDSLERRARILHAMGEDATRGGKSDEALRNFQEAHRATAATLSKQPNDPDSIFAHAQSEYYVGLAAQSANDSQTQQRHWEAYLAQAQKLANIEPETPRALMELSYANGNLCALEFAKSQKDKSRLKTAIAQCEASVQYGAAAYAKTPSDTKIAESLANRHGWLANVYLLANDPKRSLVQREKEGAILDRLIAQDPKNNDLQLRKLWETYGIARAFHVMGDHAQGFAIARKTISDVSQLQSKTGKRHDLEWFVLKLRAWLTLEQHKLGLPEWRATHREALQAFEAIDKNGPDPAGMVALKASLDALK